MYKVRATASHKALKSPAPVVTSAVSGNNNHSVATPVHRCSAAICLCVLWALAEASEADQLNLYHLFSSCAIEQLMRQSRKPESGATIKAFSPDLLLGLKHGGGPRPRGLAACLSQSGGGYSAWRLVSACETRAKVAADCLQKATCPAKPRGVTWQDSHWKRVLPVLRSIGYEMLGLALDASPPSLPRIRLGLTAEDYWHSGTIGLRACCLFSISITG